MALVTAGFFGTVIENATFLVLRVSMTFHEKNPESARNVNGPDAPARRTRATSSPGLRLSS
jgi:hypothetical protein